MAVNPFVWSRPLDDPAKIVGMDGFAREVALTLKGQTNVALFGPRDTGKTTFTTQLARELERDHGADAPPHVVIRVNLERAFSVPAFIACVHDAMVRHPARAIQREARRQLSALEKELGFDIKVVKGAVRRSGVTPAQDAEALHAALASLARLGDRVVVVFDEFQRLHRCPGDPLAIIRSALMGPGTDHVSLLMTGSIREALELMLSSSREPIFGEAAHMELPDIPEVEFLEYLEYQFEATAREAPEEALLHLLALTSNHPKRTQQLAWGVWNAAARRRRPMTIDLVDEVYEEALDGPDAGEFQATVGLLSAGGEAEANEVRALFLLADRGGENVTARDVVGLYGFGARSVITPALERLRAKGLAVRRGRRWRIADPFFAGWLQRHSPLALRAEDV
jgi:molybdopterin-guanine dinucleotide biosynthesis protein